MSRLHRLAPTQICRPGAVARILLAGLLAGGVAREARAQTRDPYSEPRQTMVADMIAAEGVKNERVLDSMRATPRHLFVKATLKHLAYTDQALDIGFKQTISPPFIVAYMTEVLDPQPTDRVLEIGTGSGYQAAVLSPLVKEVYTIEIVEPLGNRAKALLKQLKYENVHAKVGDGYLGWPEEAPFDKIIVTCSPESIPKPLEEQLKEGGKMIIPLGERYQQVFYLLEKKNGKLEQTRLLPTLFVPMTGKAEEGRQVQPDPLKPSVANAGFEEDVDENGQADGWHYHRRARIDEEAPSGGKRCLKFENSEPGRASHVLQAFGIDGVRVTGLDVRVMHKQMAISAGRAKGEHPGLVIHFFDGRRLPIAQVELGPWLANEDRWTEATKRVPVPREAREAIVQLGLNGAAGTLWADDVQVTPAR
jgi:protein-L-isoaspartate(D-aspartate) O-methyltransferase